MDSTGMVAVAPHEEQIDSTRRASTLDNEDVSDTEHSHEESYIDPSIEIRRLREVAR
jgi:hypothetical protein